ncbi:tRNA (uridine(34)/cytosine(34)/5-carboxymethylaminomethyluridine(34)-2'-O)-methyltransferase TrmL [Arenicella xantha]|uniref:tRNA (cytidine(34)-2'-O)-methyltransferase n=1 Tax=Arenicella xantha TaxID=644221 RepID=A0A395JPC0_9GAMM|nr:tRNA (uridine(34)/cytosine(34)/5-carboxymethylaminomethyluridine(34)-2'-O)-methyltransferase TrmL [Arenicella xantha]RBP53484.1 tRNA (cytidine/uridine-2'-O-)-methyltransferase [Arenicella xantha]
MLNVVLHNPKIPPNTGNVIRLMANTGCHLHLIEPLGFDFAEKQLRRAGLDYHDLSTVSRHESYATFLASVKPQRVFAITTKGSIAYTEAKFVAGDTLLFGSETDGLPAPVMDQIALSERLRIPMQASNRSLNLSNSVAIVVYEAWRQLGFVNGS